MNSTKKITDEITSDEDKKIEKKNINEKVKKEPKNKIISVGTKKTKPNEKPDDSTDDSDQENESIDNGFYTLDATYLKADEDESSAMSGYMNKKVFLKDRKSVV